MEAEANSTFAALSEFYADPDNTHVPTYEEWVSTVGLQPGEGISVQVEGDSEGFIIQAYHNAETCPKCESYLVSITDEVYAERQ